MSLRALYRQGPWGKGTEREALRGSQIGKWMTEGQQKGARADHRKKLPLSFVAQQGVFTGDQDRSQLAPDTSTPGPKPDSSRQLLGRGPDGQAIKPLPSFPYSQYISASRCPPASRSACGKINPERQGCWVQSHSRQRLRQKTASLAASQGLSRGSCVSAVTGARSKPGFYVGKVLRNPRTCGQLVRGGASHQAKTDVRRPVFPIRDKLWDTRSRKADKSN